jgi:carbon-monoxide dehydrogenase medium subunit
MYPRSFDYAAPTSLEEALDILAEKGDEVKILAGGQSLIPLLKTRLADYPMLLDINRIPGLDSIEAANGHLSIGALVRHADVVDSDVVAAESGAIASAAPWVADPIVRNLGTFCGSVAHHDPEGDWASVVLATGGDVVVQSRDGGERVIAIEDFLVDMFTTSCGPTEMVTEIRVPRYATGGGNYQKLERKIGDYATVGVATHLELDDAGVITKAGIALTSVHAHNLKVTEAEEVLVGEVPADRHFAEAAQIAKAACDPTSDVRGSAEYKKDVVRVLTERSLSASLAAATGE